MSVRRFEPTAVLGLGAMGKPVAEVLLAAGVPLTLWNRTASVAEHYRATAARVASTPAEAAEPIVLTVLPDLAQVDQLLRGSEGLLSGWQRRKVADPALVVMGTVSPVAVTALAAELAAEGVRVIDAPMSGGVTGAREARLSIMVGATPGDYKRVRPLFEVLGSTVRLLGPVGSGQLAKACNQMIVGTTVAAVAEAVLLARSAGIPILDLFDLLGAGLANSEVLKQKRERFESESFTPEGLARYQVKDLGFAIAAGERTGVRLPVTGVVRDLFSALEDEGDGGLDNSGIYRHLQRLSGIPTTEEK